MADKYVVFKIDDWLYAWKEMKERNKTGDWDIDLEEHPFSKIQKHRIDDAVVIRTQDIFAGPALHTYAAMIDIGAKLSGNKEVQEQLMPISDYFHLKAVEADEQGDRVPD